MTITRTEQALERALLEDGDMDQDVFDRDLEVRLGDLQASLEEDGDHLIFSVSEIEGAVAMVLIEKSGKVHVNEHARDQLKAVWKTHFRSNMKRMIPGFASEIHEGLVPLCGLKIADATQAGKKRRGFW